MTAKARAERDSCDGADSASIRGRVDRGRGPFPAKFRRRLGIVFIVSVKLFLMSANRRVGQD